MLFRSLIAGNWKMNGSAALIESFGKTFASATLPEGVEVVIIPPFPYLDMARHAFGDTPLALGARASSSFKAALGTSRPLITGSRVLSGFR